ncbi:MAG: hypothetical protein IT307_01455 [Chloroflexi bacterium]|nr:hypothetical protein [Chloroflexota bacterium]
MGVALRPYQLAPLRAILDSVLNDRGLVFSVMFPRQAGKNQLSAHLEAYLLQRHVGHDWQIVKTAPTFEPQLRTSMRRLQGLLANPFQAHGWHVEAGNRVVLGRAAALFLSAEPSANVVGATAHLLEVDEAQDVDPDKFDRDFRPMGATANATTVIYGTPWLPDDLLGRTVRENREREAADGVRRHFETSWQEVAAENPAYGRYVEGEIARLGADHPLIRTQYLLLPLASGGGFFSPEQRAALQGEHARQRQPAPGARYVAGVDLAGEDEQAQDATLRALKPRKDSTVVTIAEVVWQPIVGAAAEPLIRVVEQYWWTGVPHRQLFERLVALLGRTWRCARIAVDATGVGAGVASFLADALGRAIVDPVVFTAPRRSELTYALLAAIARGGLKLYAPDGSPEYRECWTEIDLAISHPGPSGRLSVEVPPERGHDDFLSALALTVEAARHGQPRVAVGRRRDEAGHGEPGF